MSSWRKHANAPAPGTILGALSDIAEGGSEFVIGRGLSAFRLFAVRQGDGVRAYINKCPHYSLPLNHRPNQFLTRDGSRIMCRQHLALFEIDDGSCIDGACEGVGLEAVEVRIDDDMLVVC